MKDVTSLAKALYNRRVRSILDLYASGVLSIAALGYAGEKGRILGVRLAVGGILAVLLLATFADGGWFKKRSHRGQRSSVGKPSVPATSTTAALDPVSVNLPKE